MYISYVIALFKKKQRYSVWVQVSAIKSMTTN